MIVQSASERNQVVNYLHTLAGFLGDEVVQVRPATFLRELAHAIAQDEHWLTVEELIERGKSK